MSDYTPKQLERFWQKVDKSAGEDGCWLWIAAKATKWGYGYFYLSNKYVYAHRLSYQLTYGPIPDGLHVCHHCDNPPCCNPKHLFAGTRTDNMRDMVKKGRSRRDEHKGNAHLTIDMVRQIRQRYPQSGITQQQLADEYDISRRTIRDILNRRTWRE